jgi:hypothetical protein
MIRRSFLFAASALALIAGIAPADARDQWTKKQANDWHARQPWQVGANYTPATAINQLEMFQAETWDPKRIDLELGWAEAMGMNVMRVNLHNLLWETDPEGLKRRMDEFMTIAAKHKIKTLWIFFDSCWDPIRTPARSIRRSRACTIRVRCNRPAPRVSRTRRNTASSKLM